jgi:hypothetical protein
LPILIERGEITFGVHNLSALFGPRGPRRLVFCLPSLFTFQGHSIFLSKSHLLHRGLSDEDDIASLSNEQKRSLIRKAVVSVECNTDLELAVFEAIESIGLNYPKDVDIRDEDADVGYINLLEGTVDAYCGGLNHAKDLDKQGYKALFLPNQINVLPVNGIVTTPENFKKHTICLSLFAAFWFWTIQSLKMNEDKPELLDTLCRHINRSTTGAVTPDTLKQMLSDSGALNPKPKGRAEESKSIQAYLQQVNSFRRAQGLEMYTFSKGDPVFRFLNIPQIGERKSMKA